MRYAFYDHHGAATDVLALAEGPVPSPGPGEVLIRVLASGINPSDVMTRAGNGPGGVSGRVVPHSDGAGIVEAVGDGVPGSRVGERVWLWNGQWKRQWGTAADYIALPADQAVRLPDNLSFEVGATLGVPWMTAWRAVHYHPHPGDKATMLVQGGAGAVGFYAIQLARRAGYRVFTTVSSPEKAKVARDAGADVVIDYSREDIGSVIAEATGGAGVDRIVEVALVGNAPSYNRILRPAGSVAAYGLGGSSTELPLRDWLVHGVELAIFIVYNMPPDIRAQAVADSHAALADPGFKAMIAARFPLDRIAEAHELVESKKTIGNVVIV